MGTIRCCQECPPGVWLGSGGGYKTIKGATGRSAVGDDYYSIDKLKCNCLFDLKCPEHIEAKCKTEETDLSFMYIYGFIKTIKNGSHCLRRAYGCLSKKHLSLGVKPKSL